MKNSKKDEIKKPLDMTTEEAVGFLFPKDVTDELKHIANPHSTDSNHYNDLDDDDSAYEQPNR